jgi:hypothetical protein
MGRYVVGRKCRERQVEWRGKEEELVYRWRDNAGRIGGERQGRREGAGIYLEKIKAQ